MAATDPHKQPRQQDGMEKIPPILIRAMFGLVLFALVVVAWARLTDQPLSALPDHDAPIAVERQIVIEGSNSGRAIVYDIEGNIIREFGPLEGGFISGVWRVLRHERGKIDAPLDAPVRLVRFESGRLSLYDDLTGWRAELIGFGADNAAAFARLLD
ncbi:photosynthetic complex assembly protein PuhC [Rhodovulum steppense]|uniref:Putative photosynthetic complex assembly protein n=1 Tax=Rhodovulum steppense TaxID=540251 RepID=A0A4R1Z0Z0_9RHOB|nr:photosynthetic complex assembly protein PuhC [Rhodovulum steppense]TCM87016.1 putative photosynthetic complex assembly protein [Rhodovulum steppense]